MTTSALDTSTGTSGRNSQGKVSAVEFGQKIRSLKPGCPSNEDQLSDWHRRVALSMMPALGLRVGSRRSVKFLQAAGL